jgi:simple sugar transport system ATP-binding protein
LWLPRENVIHESGGSELTPFERGETPALALRGLTKSFGAVAALRGIDIEIRPGEVVGLVGDNGAGKSTLIKTISGVHAPDGGQIELYGVSRDHLTAVEARHLGIETIHQSLALVNTLDVASNIFLNREKVRRNGLARVCGWLDKRGMYAESVGALEAFGLPRSLLRRPVRDLSGGQRQMVAIARAIYWRPKIIMMDEPTAALAVAHAAKVLELVRRMADSGIAVLFVSHDMRHVLEVTDRVVVLRHGSKVADLRTSETSHQEIVMFITGHELSEKPSAGGAKDEGVTR